MRRMATQLTVTSATDAKELEADVLRRLRTRPVQLIGVDSRRVRDLVVGLTKRLKATTSVKAIRGHTQDGRLSVTLWVGDRLPLMLAAPSPGPAIAPSVTVAFPGDYPHVEEILHVYPGDGEAPFVVDF